jgi:hypothetical protein
MVVPVEEQTFDDELVNMEIEENEDKLDPQDPQQQLNGLLRDLSAGQ